MSIQEGHLWRLLHPLVQDLISGIAAARPANRPGVAPSLDRKRPVMVVKPSDWPPEDGDYTPDGFVRGPGGALAALGLALTFDEVRSFLIGLCQVREPGLAASGRIAKAANSLVEVLTRLEHLDRDDCRRAWTALFDALICSHHWLAHTENSTPIFIGSCTTRRAGVYLATATVGISGAGAVGSLRVAATFYRDRELVLIASDRSLAQLQSGLRGVDARFTVMRDSIGLQLTGLGAKLQWDCVAQVQLPTKGECQE